MSVFRVKGTAAGQASASVIFIKVLLALGRFGSPCWSGHDDLEEKIKAFPSCTENGDVSRGYSAAALAIQPHLKNNEQPACSKLKTTTFKVEVFGIERHSKIRRHEHFCTVSCLSHPVLVVKTIL